MYANTQFEQKGSDGMDIKGREITEKGVFTTGKNLKRSGLTILAIVVLASFLVCFQVFVRSWGLYEVAVPIMLIAVMFIFGIQNIYLKSRLDSADFSGKETQEIIAIDYSEKESALRYVAFVRPNDTVQDNRE